MTQLTLPELTADSSRMRALSLTQPWCGLMAVGIKGIENRSQSMISARDFGKPIGQHATREIDKAVFARIGEIAPELWLEPPFRVENNDYAPRCEWARLSLITSAIIAVATPVRVIKAIGRDNISGLYIYDPEDLAEIGDQRRWLFGKFGYVFKDARVLTTPVPCRGFQGCWTMPTEIAALVNKSLASGVAST